MTATERAIRDSIKGGYVYVSGHREESIEWLVGLFIEEKYKTLYDPDFWRCLGIARGWIDKDYPNGSMRCNIKVGGEQCCDTNYCSYAGYKNPADQQKLLIDFLNDKKSAEDFFISLEG